MDYFDRTRELLIEAAEVPLHKARTTGKSAVHGTQHFKNPGSPTEEELHHTNRVWDNVQRDMNTLHDAGKGITLRSEGIAKGHKGSEQRHLHDLAVAHAKKNKMDLAVDTMEHGDSDTDNPESKIVQHYHKKHGEHETNAALFAMHHGQGRSHKESAHHLTPESRVHLDKMYGAPEGPEGSYSEDQKQMMFSASFPRDAKADGDENEQRVAAHLENWKGNKEAEKHLKRQVSMVDHFNAERQRLAMEYVKSDEAEGRASILTIGEGHFEDDHGGLHNKFYELGATK